MCLFFPDSLTFSIIRNNYCVKETSTLTKQICGQSEYFGDMYVNSECQFKKCADTCEESDWEFFYDGQRYTRKRYCCSTDLCNSGLSALFYQNNRVLHLLSIIVGIYLLVNL